MFVFVDGGGKGDCMETLSALLVDFLSAYKVDVEVVDYIKTQTISISMLFL